MRYSSTREQFVVGFERFCKAQGVSNVISLSGSRSQRFRVEQQSRNERPKEPGDVLQSPRNVDSIARAKTPRNSLDAAKE